MIFVLLMILAGQTICSGFSTKELEDGSVDLELLLARLQQEPRSSISQHPGRWHATTKKFKKDSN